MLLDKNEIAANLCFVIDKLYGGPAGNCYLASEAYYHLCGGKEAGLKPMNMKWEGSSHWYVEDNGDIVDLTSSQFSRPPNYSLGVGRGFLTKQPSKRTASLIVQIYDCMGI